jgi:peptidoglycan hydrolase-like protein with peptidoglycan-binding domain
MPISSSVGLGGVNKPADVKEVQGLLQPFAPEIKVDGVVGQRTIAIIKAYQRAVVGSFAPDGRIDPGGGMYQKLVKGMSVVGPRKTWDDLLSGANWLKPNATKYPNSKSLNDLSPVFKPRVTEFLDALKSAGLPVLTEASNQSNGILISATRRNKNRAFLMHYSWKIAKGSTPSTSP